MPKAVGRPPWATPDQLEYLQEHLPRLDSEKAKNGLTQAYARITLNFSKIWAPPIVEQDQKAAKDKDELKKLAYERRARVSQSLFVLCELPLTITTPANYRLVQKAPQNHYHSVSAQVDS